MKLRPPSPAMIVACLALFVALGSGAYAAFKLPAGSVGSKQLKAHSVTPGKIAPKTIKLFRGQRGPQGTPGQNGTPGSARAYTWVHANGGSPTLDPARTKGFTAVNRIGTGSYCLTLSPGISVATSAPAVTAVWNSGETLRANAQLSDAGVCASGQIDVTTYFDLYNTSTPDDTNNLDFTVVVP